MIGTSAVKATEGYYYYRVIILIVCSCFPVDDVHFIIGNDIAGGRLNPLPKLINVPLLSMNLTNWPEPV